jgi:hypothetical protein
MRRVTRCGVCCGVRLQQLPMLTAARGLRLPRFSKSSANTAAFDGWMKRTITVLYGAQLFLTVVKGVAALGSSTLVLYGLYRMQCRVDRTRELLDNAAGSVATTVTATTELIMQTASNAQASLAACLDCTKDAVSEYGMVSIPMEPDFTLLLSSPTAAASVAYSAVLEGVTAVFK